MILRSLESSTFSRFNVLADVLQIPRVLNWAVDAMNNMLNVVIVIFQRRVQSKSSSPDETNNKDTKFQLHRLCRNIIEINHSFVYELRRK
jgi:hypothetical protein